VAFGSQRVAVWRGSCVCVVALSRRQAGICVNINRIPRLGMMALVLTRYEQAWRTGVAGNMAYRGRGFSSAGYE